MFGETRGRDELDEKDERPRKQVKMRDLQSVMLSSDINTHNPYAQRNKEVSDQLQGGGEKVLRTTKELVTVDLAGSDQLERSGADRSKSTEVFVRSDMGESDPSQGGKHEISKAIEAIVTVVSDAVEVEKSGGEISRAVVRKTPMAFDLNTKLGVGNKTVDDNPVSADNFEIPALIGEFDSVYGNKTVAASGAGLDLNAETVAGSGNQDPFHPFKSYNQLKASEVSECGSTTGSQEEKDSHKIWQQMKQNGFLSSSFGGGKQIPMPKQRGRKTRGDTNKKKMDIAQKEQVDRLTKISAPSGLLNDLNPGIINHVRNRKQVHSIIEAVVKSEKHENSRFYGKQISRTNVGNKEIGYRKEIDSTGDLGSQRFLFSHQGGERQTKAYNTSMGKSLPFMSKNTSGDGNSSMVHRVCGTQSPSLSEHDPLLPLKLSSANKGHENFCSLSHEESANLSFVSSLSVKAANVALQWLELLHQDIKGRLAALRRSKKRVRDVITSELPLLIAKEIPSNEVKDPYHLKRSTDVLFSNSVAEIHRAKWSALFSNMDQSLADEERQLENWLYQVRDMQRHCEQGLQFSCTMPHGFQHTGASYSGRGSIIKDKFEKDLAIRAAAASIYSTCNFLSSEENVCC